ncbi:uncharacterized protein LOC133176400 [Saccostrea echinata]|uniref:uncharacterized protein LOC133176400 n=1 Tax=Saccostrea echinata TaxID=191078 RepID=UPI002A83FA77|nr:uncharacterized protein LOC133176400 [Saccostrea echinata]
MSAATKSKPGPKRKLTDSARKRNKKEANSKLNKNRIYIGDQYDRWTELKTDLHLNNNTEVAKILLDRYLATQPPIEYQVEEIQKTPVIGVQVGLSTPDVKHVQTSTPGPSYKTLIHQLACPVSDISSELSNRDEELSGVEALPTKRRKLQKSTLSNSFLYSPQLSVIDITETDDHEDDSSSDSDYEPSFNISLRPNTANFTSLDIENYSDEEEYNENEDDDICEPSTDVQDMVKISKAEDITSDQSFLVYNQCLMKLAAINVPKTCTAKNCGAEVSVTRSIIGSAVHLKWVCRQKHVLYEWCSQPILNRRMHSGDLMLASAILLSGNNFKKIELMCKFLNLPIISNTTFHKIQRTYLIPSVDEFWADNQLNTINQFLGEDLVILGDGRMDSPGHSAQFCSYTFMEYSSKKILCVVTMDKRITELKSTNLEKACFIKGLNFLLDSGLKIVEVVTDAHNQIAAVMKKDYKHIRHSFDIWHGTKNLGKKIMSVGQETDKKELLNWTKDIMNHFWYSAQISETYEEFIGVWFGLLHHVTDEHEWILAYGDNASSSCSHGPLTEERTKGWMQKGSPAHVALRYIVMDKRRLNQVHYYLNCRSTAELENFQNLILVYASKRHSYSPPTYRTRNYLAALDQNGHCERETKKNKDGSIKYQRSFNKKSGVWSVHELKAEKNYPYIPALIHKIITK